MWRSRTKFNSLHDYQNIDATKSENIEEKEMEANKTKLDASCKFEKGAEKMRRTSFDDTIKLLNFAWYNEGNFAKELSFKMQTDLFTSQISVLQQRASLSWVGPYFEFRDNHILQHLIQKELKNRLKSESAKNIVKNLQ